ncbi:MAG: hemerythrin domain-containing protein [Trebonia sp.]
MTELASRRPRPEYQPLAAPVPRAGSADVVELILADHRRIRRLSQSLDDAVRWAARSGPDWAPAHVWQRLAELLQAHTRAEEEICYLLAARSGPHADARTRDMAADHDDIREAIAEAALQPAGSALWWRAVRTVQTNIPLHLDHEERDILVSLQHQLTTSRRLEIGRQWTAFTAAWMQDASQSPPRPVAAAQRVNQRPS